jgi:hypothetical protein
MRGRSKSSGLPAFIRNAALRWLDEPNPGWDFHADALTSRESMCWRSHVAVVNLCVIRVEEWHGCD